VALICPTFSATELKQALGRIHRAGGRSKSVQKIIFTAGTIEEKICETVRRKLGNLELLNDGDLQGEIKW
jgi:superfamily II DNA or RNA helicase